MTLKEIAEGLSEAQRAALCELPSDRHFTPADTGFQWPTLAVLKSKRLIAAVAEGGAGKNALHYLPGRGLEVRNYLLENPQ